MAETKPRLASVAYGGARVPSDLERAGWCGLRRENKRTGAYVLRYGPGRWAWRSGASGGIERTMRAAMRAAAN